MTVLRFEMMFCIVVERIGGGNVINCDKNYVQMYNI